MSMTTRPIRFPDHQWERACEEAQLMGISVAEFIREATLARIALETERRLGPDRSLKEIVTAASGRAAREA